MSVTTQYDGVSVRADRSRISQAVLALLDNAARYAPNAELHLAVEGEANQAVILVADRGPGMPDAELKHAFERFWWADGARNRRGGGSGLGLSVVRAIARAHSDTAKIGNRARGGIDIRVEIPRS